MLIMIISIKKVNKLLNHIIKVKFTSQKKEIFSILIIIMIIEKVILKIIMIVIRKKVNKIIIRTINIDSLVYQ